MKNQEMVNRQSAKGMLGGLSISRALGLGFSVTLMITVIICITVIWFSWMIGRSQSETRDMQQRALYSVSLSRQMEQWMLLLRQTEAEQTRMISLLYQRQLQNAEEIVVSREDADPLKALLESQARQDMVIRFPETGPHFKELEGIHQRTIQTRQKMTTVWRQSHAGLADLLHEVRRTMVYWTLKVANMIFVQSSIDELLFENLEDTPLGKLQSHPLFVESAKSIPLLLETMEKTRPLNQRLWEAAFELDTHIMMSEWDQARKLYRDVFPAATKSIGVYLDNVIESEEDILAAQSAAGTILNEEMVPLNGATLGVIKKLRGQLNGAFESQQHRVATQTTEMEQTWHKVERIISSIKWVIIFLTIISGLFSLVFINWISKRIIRPIKNLALRTNAISKGDLSRDNIPNGRKDEIGLLINSVNEMSGSLHELVFRFSTTMNDVASTAGKISVASRQTAAGMNEQALFVSDIRDKIGAISRSAETIEERVQEVTRQSRSAEQTAKDSIETVNEALRRMTDIQGIFSSLSEGIMQLKVSSLEIGQIIGLITDIARKSHLLSMNASIEAAHAGARGKGFMVITEEMKNLSRQTLTATERVEAFILDIQDKTQKAVDMSSEGMSAVIDGSDLSKVAQGHLGMIARNAEQVAEMIQTTTTIVKSQSDQTQFMTSLIEEISVISQQSNVCANETVNIGVRLNEKSNEIQSVLSHFQLN
ncbi:methyl-accepting chemotaxis protein [bacterium]|nr:methyl-accepting chemotaxis protein [bacterium]